MTTPDRARAAEAPSTALSAAGLADPPGRARPSLSRLVRALESVEEAERAAVSGRRAQALRFFGMAIDDFLEEGLYTMAASTAQRTVDRFPEVVRARGTLAVLSLAEGLDVLSAGVLDLVRRDFEAYVAAARAAGQTQATTRHLRVLARETESPVVREWLSEFLEMLGDRVGAEQVFLSAREERQGIRVPRPMRGTQQQRWAAVLRRSAHVPA